ncbi:hypothetical protein CDAR_480561 [Caerostris darwini]|uniref:Uncharacterized protein n=1 Tax=Caerostris darwini TaxID=1538125 RepID=A0AAV4UIB9_9ARAC|nr:hypothetical protein CDAR_480561 [Caerostris darwini]
MTAYEIRLPSFPFCKSSFANLHPLFALFIHFATCRRRNSFTYIHFSHSFTSFIHFATTTYEIRLPSFSFSTPSPPSFTLQRAPNEIRLPSFTFRTLSAPSSTLQRPHMKFIYLISLFALLQLLHLLCNDHI